MLTILAILIVFPGPRQKISVSLRSTMYMNLPGDQLDQSKFQSSWGESRQHVNLSTSNLKPVLDS